MFRVRGPTRAGNRLRGKAGVEVRGGFARSHLIERDGIRTWIGSPVIVLLDAGKAKSSARGIASAFYLTQTWLNGIDGGIRSDPDRPRAPDTRGPWRWT